MASSRYKDKVFEGTHVQSSLILRPTHFFWLHKEASNEKLGWGMGIRLYKVIVYTYDPDKGNQLQTKTSSPLLSTKANPCLVLGQHYLILVQRC